MSPNFSGSTFMASRVTRQNSLQRLNKFSIPKNIAAETEEPFRPLLLFFIFFVKELLPVEITVFGLHWFCLRLC